MRGRAFVVALFVACSPFGSSGPGSSSKTDGGLSPPATQVDAGSQATDGAPGPSGDGGRPQGCADAPPNVFCDDFSSQTWDLWKDKQPQFTRIDPSAAFFVTEGVPSPPVAMFEFDGRDEQDCAYGWVRRIVDVNDKSAIRVELDLRLLAIPEKTDDEKDAILLVTLKDQAERPIENYLMIAPVDDPVIYEQWTETDTKEAFHHLGAVKIGEWMHLALSFDAGSRNASLAIDGEVRSTWKLGLGEFGAKLGSATVGLGFICTTIGGEVQYDNVLVTAN